MPSPTPPFFDPDIETMGRGDLETLVEERVKYTIQYAEDHSLFYRKWFEDHGIKARDMKCHEDLLALPIITGRVLREHQPPKSKQFLFQSASQADIFTIHETSGTTGVPKSFFLTWEDWERHAYKYARIFRSQGFDAGDRVLMCASYGMNIGANTMTLAARNIGMTIIPEGRCFPRGAELLQRYRPSGVVASVFKLLRLARQLKREGINPQEVGVRALIAGGEAFAEEARQHVAGLWGCPVYNTYGSTEGTMCGECSAVQGLHVAEDLVHVDIYDPHQKQYVPDGECGHIVLSTLLPPGGKSGMLLLNYDTEDTSVVVSREQCTCGRTHFRIMNPQREAETLWIAGNPFNRVDIERGVFHPRNMAYLTGEYEAFLEEDTQHTILRVNLEAEDPGNCDSKAIEENFVQTFLKTHPPLEDLHNRGVFKFDLHILAPGKFAATTQKGRAKRLIDRRQV